MATIGSTFDSEDNGWLTGVRRRLTELGYGPDEATTREVASQCRAHTAPSDDDLHAAVGLAQVVRAMQRSLA